MRPGRECTMAGSHPDSWPLRRRRADDTRQDDVPLSGHVVGSKHAMGAATRAMVQSVLSSSVMSPTDALASPKSMAVLPS
jgi:hypothetical protein